MGRWVTSKGRRIYIPDEGEENPFVKKERPLSSKNDYNAVIRDAKSKEELMNIAKEVGNNSNISSEIRDELIGTIHEKAQSLKNQNKKDQINKDLDTKEKQIANNKKQADTLNNKTISPIAQANNMTETELRAYVKKNKLTKNYNMMLNNRTNYSQGNQMKVLRDLVSDDIAMKEARKRKKNK